MKSVYLLSCILFMNLSGVGWEDDNGDDYSIPIAPRWCPTSNCRSLEKECALHNKRLIFFNHMRQQSKIKKAKQIAPDQPPVLPMLPEVLKHLIGSYAQEIKYRIKDYEQVPYDLHRHNVSPLDNKGYLVMGSNNTSIIVQSTCAVPKYPSISVVLTPIEEGFFRYTLEPKLEKSVLAPEVIWQYTSDENITMLMWSEEDQLHSKDKLLLKLSSPENKALKATGLLPKKKKN